MKTLKQVRNQMYGDLYATEATGATIEEIDEKGRVHARLEIEPRHYNSAGRVMDSKTRLSAMFDTTTNSAPAMPSDMIHRPITASVIIRVNWNGKILLPRVHSPRSPSSCKSAVKRRIPRLCPLLKTKTAEKCLLCLLLKIHIP